MRRLVYASRRFGRALAVEVGTVGGRFTFDTRAARRSGPFAFDAAVALAFDLRFLRRFVFHPAPLFSCVIAYSESALAALHIIDSARSS